MPQVKNKSKIQRLLQGFIAVKILALSCMWLIDVGWLRFGEHNLQAADEKEQVAKADTKKSETKNTEAKQQAAEKNDKKDQAPKTRLSFLANLLELPELNPDSIKKDELGQYLEIAERKKRQVEERIELLKKRENQLKGLENSIDGKLKQLDEERRFFAQTLQKEKELKGERIEKLVTLYAKMEPKKASPIFEQMDRDLVVELFKQLPQKQVTAILEGMNPQKSVQLSEYYGRVRSAREYDLLKEMNQSLRKEFDECKGMPAP